MVHALLFLLLIREANGTPSERDRQVQTRLSVLSLPVLRSNYGHLLAYCPADGFKLRPQLGCRAKFRGGSITDTVIQRSVFTFGNDGVLEALPLC
jgi:hypothetical protein